MNVERLDPALRRQHAELNGDPDRRGDQTHGQVGAGDNDREHNRDRGHDHDRDGDSAASSGYDDDASM